jgi:hypothetical protein
MKILVEYNQTELQSIMIENAKYIGDFAVRIAFNDGTQKLVDFKNFLSKSFHPSIQKYLDEKLFASFQIIDGNLNWNDYDMIFPIGDLYNGSIDI